MSSQSNLIHQTAIIDPGAEIGDGVEVGPYSIIEQNVRIGSGCKIASHAVIASGTRLADECRIFNSAVVGNIPQDLKFEGEDSELVIGERTVIREFCTLNRGTKQEKSVTRVGSDCLLMAYVHVAHDCVIGNNVIIANATNMGGHVTIEDNVIIGGVTAIHQFVKIGRNAFIGGQGRVSQDVPPYIITVGEKYNGINSVGLRRHGFSSEQISSIKKAYRLIYRSKLNLSQAVDAIKSELEPTEEIKTILEFIDRSSRGLTGR